jgi:hypothetical protein
LRIQRKRDLDGSFGNQLSQYGIWKKPTQRARLME